MAFLCETALRLMSQQYGLITRPQLLRCEHTHGEIAGHVRRTNLETVLCGTYRIRGSGVPVEQWPMACQLRCRPKARLSGELVLGLLGVKGCSSQAQPLVLVPDGRKVQQVPFLVRTDPAPDRFGATREALKITVPALAVVEIARTADDRRLRTTIDAARWANLLDARRLERCASGLGRHPGAERVLCLLRSGELALRSEGERGLRNIFCGFQPEPEYNVWIAPHLCVDLLWRDCSYILEYDGEEYHAGELGRARDRPRDQELKRRGYHVDHLTKGDLRHPEATRARVLAVRSALLSRRLGRLAGCSCAREHLPSLFKPKTAGSARARGEGAHWAGQRRRDDEALVQGLRASRGLREVFSWDQEDG